MSAFTMLWRGYLEQPREISLETFARCNASCTFCPYTTLERIGTKMPDELIDRLVKEMAAFKRPFYFSPFKVNEPLLDRRTLPLMRRMNDEVPLASLRLFSNGSTLTADNLRQVAELKNLDCLWVSLNEYRPAEYEALMGLKFDQTAKKLDALHEMDFPHRVVLSCVGFPNERFRYYCFRRWPKFESTALKRDAWIDFTDSQRKDVPDEPCQRWFELNIMATGKVAHCCMHSGEEEQYNIGDLNKQTLLEVYNSWHWRERREKLMSRKLIDPCARCTY